VFTVLLETGSLEGVTLLQPEDLAISVDKAETDEQVHWELPESRVLVVDDGDENRELATLVLEEVGLIVDTATNGREGMEKALAGDFEVVLMDIQMPVMDGFTAIDRLRSAGYEQPVFALTAHAMAGFKEKCLQAGFSGYITKPIEIDVLIETLAELLGGRRVEGETQSLASEQDSNPIPELEVDQSPVVSRLASNSKFHPVIEKFIDRLDEQLAAIDLARNSQDFAELASLAHWLKGAGGTVGFDAFSEPARELETCAKEARMEGVEASIEILKQIAGRISLPKQDDQSEVGHQTVIQTEVPIAAPVDGENFMEAANPAETIQSRLAGNPRFHPIIEKFVLRLNEQLNAMDEAWEVRDLTELASLAHWLKGAGGTVGFDAFTESAKNFEQLVKAGLEAQIPDSLASLHQLADRIELPSVEAGDNSAGKQHSG